MPRKRRLVPWLDTIGDVYYAFWYNAEKRRTDRLSLGVTDPGKAEVAFTAFLNERHQILDVASGAALLTCGDALTHYWVEHVLHGVVDQARTKSKIKYLRLHFERIPIPSVSIQTSRDYVVKRREGAIGKPAGDGTIHTELTTLVAALHHEEKWKRIPNGSAPYIEKPSKPAPKERWLTTDELRQVVEAAEKRALPLWGFVNIAYYTAARRRSVETLTWFQWPEESERINLNPVGRRQTNKRRPIVPTDPALKYVRARLWEAYGATSYVLGGTHEMWYGFRQICDELGFTDVTPHTLRHSRATHLLQRGVDPWKVANLLGDSITTVIKVYGHHCPDYLAETIGHDMSAEDLLK